MTENKKRMLKELIRQLHAGVSPQEVKEGFKHVLKGISPLEISKIEQELIEEGMPRDEIQRLCDIHLAVFWEQLEKQKLEVPIGHPISILMEEHKIMLQLAEKLGTIANKVQQASDISHVSDEMHSLEHIAEDLETQKNTICEKRTCFSPFLKNMESQSLLQ